MQNENVLTAKEEISRLMIRVERQRERAERWTVKYSVLEGENDSLRKQRQELNTKIENLFVEYEALIAQIEDENDQTMMDLQNQIYSLRGLINQTKHTAWNDGYDQAMEDNKRAIAIGKKELNRQYKERLNKKVQQLITMGNWYDDKDEPVQWLRRAIKRINGVSSNMPVFITETSKCVLTGEPGYHTTPSGKTIVSHPGAYGYRTVYHTSTERLEVGKRWINANIKKLALSEAKMRVKGVK